MDLKLNNTFLLWLFALANIDVLTSATTIPNEHKWDILIFTQHWPLTVCLQWKEKENQHTCSMPKLKNIWTVHGIWPTKLGTMGPQFCNNSIHFDIHQLQPIEDQMELYWLNVFNGTREDSLWRHEWRKHGTCAAQLPSLDTESKYFGQGLSWIQKYNMQSILGNAGISPDAQGYTAQQVWDAIKGVLGKNPAIGCIKDPKTGQSFLFEIKVCFDKNLHLTDCDGIKGMNTNSSSEIHTNCDPDQLVIYPGSIPVELRLPPPPRPQSCRTPWLITSLRLIQWLQWMTL